MVLHFEDNQICFPLHKITSTMSIRSLAVFCGSKNGNDPVYVQHAAQLGKILADHQITLIYGGGSIGIMGTIADAVMMNGGKVTGIIPQVLVDWERQHTSISELIIVDNMHVRKKKMYELSDAAVILPGGFGTLDELFEMVTWNQLSIHDKHIYIINLIAHIQKMLQEGFLYESAYNRVIIINTPADIIPYLNKRN
jgi:uncharacterized protein (TIGR00730 family)